MSKGLKKQFKLSFANCNLYARYIATMKQPVSLAKHQDWKQGVTASLAKCKAKANLHRIHTEGILRARDWHLLRIKGAIYKHFNHTNIYYRC